MMQYDGIVIALVGRDASRTTTFGVALPVKLFSVFCFRNACASSFQFGAWNAPPT